MQYVASLQSCDDVPIVEDKFTERGLFIETYVHLCLKQGYKPHAAEVASAIKRAKLPNQKARFDSNLWLTDCQALRYLRKIFMHEC